MSDFYQIPLDMPRGTPEYLRWERLNFALRQIFERIGNVDGRQTTLEYKNELDMGGNPIKDGPQMTSAQDTDFVTKSYFRTSEFGKMVVTLLSSTGKTPLPITGSTGTPQSGGGGGGGGGTSDHALLTHLSYATANHTGFVPDTRQIGTTAPLTGGGDLSTNRTIAIPAASGVSDGYLTAADWTTFNAKQDALTLGDLTELTSAVLTIGSGTGAVVGSGTTITVKQASGAQAGYLSSSDWTTFNSKMTNPMTALGDIIYGGVAGAPTPLPGNTSTDFRVLASIGDGVNPNVPSWQPIPASGLLTFFFIDTASDIGGVYKQAVGINSYTPAAKASITTSPASVGSYLGTFATNAGIPGLTFIPDGTVHIHCHAEMSPGADIAICAELYTRTDPGGVETLIATSHEETLTTSEEGYELNTVILDPIAVDATDRIVVKFKVVSGGGPGRTVTIYYDGVGVDQTFSRLEMPSPAVDATNFVPTTRTVATTSPLGGGGALSSDLTLTIQVANGSQGGYLSASDWTTFNAKISGSGTPGTIPKWATASTLGDSIITESSSKIGIGTSSPPAYKLEVEGQIKATLGSIIPAVKVLSISTGVISTDASNGNHFRVTMTDNAILGNPSNGVDGQRIVWEFLQDGTGGRVLTLDSKFSQATYMPAVILSLSPGKNDMMGAIYNATLDKWVVTGFIKEYV